MFSISQKPTSYSPSEPLFSVGESVKPVPLTDGQMTRLKALLILCLCLFLFGIAATSRQARGPVAAGESPDSPWNLKLTL